MNIVLKHKKIYLESIVVTASYLVHYDTLLQNATDISLQYATKVYYKMRSVFLSQNVTVITKCDDFTTKCDVYACVYPSSKAIFWKS